MVRAGTNVLARLLLVDEIQGILPLYKKTGCGNMPQPVFFCIKIKYPSESPVPITRRRDYLWSYAGLLACASNILLSFPSKLLSGYE